MPRYACFDPDVPFPSPVIAWLDTDEINYGDAMPNASALVELNDVQWADRLSNPSGFAVNATNAIIPHVQQEQQRERSAEELIDDEVDALIANGFAVTFESFPAALSSRYAVDDQTMNEIGSVARDAGSGLGLPGGLPVFTYPDFNSVPVQFTAAQLTALYKALRDYRFHLDTAASLRKHGSQEPWPAATVTIP